jgi:hypothetical protein
MRKSYIPMTTKADLIRKYPGSPIVVINTPNSEYNGSPNPFYRTVGVLTDDYIQNSLKAYLASHQPLGHPGVIYLTPPPAPSLIEWYAGLGPEELAKFPIYRVLFSNLFVEEVPYRGFF